MDEQEQAASTPEAWHTWNYRLTRDSDPSPIEFGEAVTQEEAQRRVARHLGLKELPKEVVVSHYTLKNLGKEVQEEPAKAERKEPAKSK